MHIKALQFYLETLENPLQLGKTLLINTPRLEYLDHFKDHSISVLYYHANVESQWSTENVTVIQEEDLAQQQFDTVIFFATKFATENLTTLANIAQSLKITGECITIIPNKTGASRLKKDINKLFNEVVTGSKAKCRIFHTTSHYDQALAKKWRSLAKPKSIKNSSLVTVPGIFSAEKIDTGSKLLVEFLSSQSWHGSIADLGAGYGYLSHAILSLPRHKIKQLSLYELDRRALECAKTNLDHFSCKINYHWTDVTREIPHQRPFDSIIMNPPFHEAQDASFKLGKTFIRQAAEILKPGGTLLLVANLHLPYEKEIQSHFRSHRLLAEKDGFKLFLARK